MKITADILNLKLRYFFAINVQYDMEALVDLHPKSMLEEVKRIEKYDIKGYKKLNSIFVRMNISYDHYGLFDRTEEFDGCVPDCCGIFYKNINMYGDVNDFSHDIDLLEQLKLRRGADPANCKIMSYVDTIKNIN
jgi:hypothetical protein